MNPLFFGASDKALFGIYHAPASQPARNRGVVLCNPFGDEALKAHRAYLQLANRLASERFHVLRFDYFGTGDSYGASEEGRVEQWLADVSTAADELKDASGVAKVSFVGLRFGGSLALAGAATRKDVDRVVLWDPVVHGRPYLDRLREDHEAYLRSEFYKLDLPEARFSPPTGEEIMGYPVPFDVRHAMEATNLCETDTGKLKRAALVTSTRADDYTALVAALTERGLEVTQEHIPVGINWNSDDAMNTSLVPTEAIDAIVELLS